LLPLFGILYRKKQDSAILKFQKMIQDTQKQNEIMPGTDRFFLNKIMNFSQSSIAICQLIVNKIKAAPTIKSLIRSTRACLVLCGIEIMRQNEIHFVS
jgi:hypothetical protein